MSETTHDALETAITNHLTDEGHLEPGELVTDWLVLTAAMPEHRGPDHDAVYTVTVADHMAAHHALGLAAWYLHNRDG